MRPLIRFCDMALKALVVLPLAAFALHGLPRMRTLRQLSDIVGSVEEVGVFLLVLFIVGYGSWSAIAVYRRRRTPENTLFWALAAAIIWAVGIPGFADGQRRMAETEGRSNLHAVKSALSRYHGESRSTYPTSLEALTLDGKYLAELPKTRTPYHHDDSARVAVGKTPDDSGGWLYANDPREAGYGTLRVNCTHTDTRGTAWSAY